MTRIAEEHGIIPVPVDLDMHTLMPSLSDIKIATSSKTVAMIFAYIYGVQYDIAPYVPFLKENRIEIIEDCAQSFQSLENFRGSPYSFMTMFSFGTIKHNTALFGAVTNVKPQNEVYQGIRPMHEVVEEI